MSTDGPGWEGTASDGEETLMDSLLSAMEVADDPSQVPWYRHLDAADGNPPARQSPDLAAPPTSARQARRQSCPVLSVLDDARPFDAVRHVGPALDRRLGTTRRTRVVVEGETHRVDVRACQCPTDAGDFEDALAAELDRWERVGGVDGVVPVFVHGRTDRPWLATPSIGSTVADRDPDSPALALRHAYRLTRALAAMHDRGVVHAGIDPETVVYPLGGDRPAPAFHDVGLADLYGRHADPTTVLDARYVAPEWFDDRFGIVDRATDIYQLGMVIYRLCTGQSPVAGDAGRVREQVIDGSIPAVTDADSRFPGELDSILDRATATEKFERYDTARAFHRDVARLCKAVLD